MHANNASRICFFRMGPSTRRRRYSFIGVAQMCHAQIIMAGRHFLSLSCTLKTEEKEWKMISFIRSTNDDVRRRTKTRRQKLWNENDTLHTEHWADVSPAKWMNERKIMWHKAICSWSLPPPTTVAALVFFLTQIVLSSTLWPLCVCVCVWWCSLCCVWMDNNRICLFPFAI